MKMLYADERRNHAKCIRLGRAVLVDMVMFFQEKITLVYNDGFVHVIHIKRMGLVC